MGIYLPGLLLGPRGDRHVTRSLALQPWRFFPPGRAWLWVSEGPGRLMCICAGQAGKNPGPAAKASRLAPVNPFPREDTHLPEERAPRKRRPERL